MDRHMQLAEAGSLALDLLALSEEEYGRKAIFVSSWCFQVLVASWDLERWL
jgi:hypothetical protein